ncbi:hypothetical protein HDU98_009318 [Podochytrium sp. JEL0797]|nr:hypothetical protein HDU98_009318 [Podochytrium sp. JEL0797]
MAEPVTFMPADITPPVKEEPVQSTGLTQEDLDTILIPLSKLQFILVFVATSAAFLLAVLDGTVVSTALPSIINDFGSPEKAPWIGSIFLLTGCAVDILYGKLADVYGRKYPFIAAIALFLVGSALCGASTSMDMLIASRAVAGFGVGGIFSLSTILVSDIVSLKDRGAYQGIIGAIFGVGSILGPVVGGVLSDKLSWRWCFYINLPIGAVSIAVFMFTHMPIPEGTMLQKFNKIDLIGTAAIMSTLTALLLPIMNGGTVWAWNSAAVIACFAVSPFLVAFTIWWQTKSKDPMIPLELFVNRSVFPLLVVALLFSAAFFAAIYYVSLFFQVVNDMSATAAGLQQLPNVLAAVVMTILSGIYVQKYLSFVPFLYIGPVLMIVGAVLISMFTESTPLGLQVVYLLVFGLGTGSLLQIRILGVQASVKPLQVAMVTAISNMFNGFGGALGIALIGTIFNNLFANKVAANSALSAYLTALSALPGLQGQDMSQPLVALTVLKGLVGTGVPGVDAALGELKGLFVDAFRVAFLCLVPVAGLVMVCALFVRDEMKGLKKGGEGEEEEVELGTV